MTQLELLKTPDCPYCTKCLKLINEIKKHFPKLKVKVIDVVEHPKLVKKHRLMTVPAIIIDGKLEFVGIPDIEKLVKKLEESE